MSGSALANLLTVANQRPCIFFPPVGQSNLPLFTNSLYHAGICLCFTAHYVLLSSYTALIVRVVSACKERNVLFCCKLFIYIINNNNNSNALSLFVHGISCDCNLLSECCKIILLIINKEKKRIFLNAIQFYVWLNFIQVQSIYSAVRWTKIVC